MRLLIEFICRRGTLIGAVMFLALLPGNSANSALADQSVESDPTTQAHEAGRKIYNFRCYYCHGYSGNAKTLAANFLEPKPIDFTATGLHQLSRQSMIDAVTSGKPGTPMKGFDKVLNRRDIELVVDFVRTEFMKNGNINTLYHTVENGWPNHERYQEAFPFATGEIALDTNWEKLSQEQRAGKQLFLTSCVSCHDQGRVIDPGPIWDLRPLSYPRNHYSHKNPDAISGASIYAIHEIPPKLAKPTDAEKSGEQLFQKNCAFCHAADGTGRNWIGSFLQPKARDLTDPVTMGAMDRSRLRRVIKVGLKGTSMPAWKYVLTDPQIDALMDYINKAFHPIAD